MTPSNGPPVLNGVANVYDRAICFDAPVEMDSGLYAQQGKTLKQLRDNLMVRLGFAAMVATPPPGMELLLNSFLQDAQEDLYTRYDCLRTERWWAWQASAGSNLYDVPIDCTKALNFRRITWAGIADNGGRALQRWSASTSFGAGTHVTSTLESSFDYVSSGGIVSGATEPVWPTTLGGTVVDNLVTWTAVAKLEYRWDKLTQGINPLWYTAPQQGMPHSFDVHEYLEIYPTPDKPYVIWLRGHLGIKKFESDADYATIDSHLVFLFALALAKAHYRHPDANTHASRANTIMHKFVAQSHGLKRYIPRVSTAGLKFPWNWPDGCGPCAMPRGTWRA